jgi:hypothetical protein
MAAHTDSTNSTGGGPDSPPLVEHGPDASDLALLDSTFSTFRAVDS